MPINQQRLTTKLQAILSKDVAAITNQKVNIPFLSADYDLAALQGWLDKRTSLLNNARTFTDAQLTSAVNNAYQSLGSIDKAIADQILSNQRVSLDNATSSSAYDSLV